MKNALLDINQIIQLLAEHKRIVANLYNNYYQQFPQENFWLILADSKHKNHELIKNLKVDAIQKMPDDSLFKSAALKIALDWVARLIQESRQHTLPKALYYSLDLEQSKIEKKYLDMLKAERQIAEIMQLLDTESRNHIAIIKHELVRIY